jgi:hypothetical protein
MKGNLSPGWHNFLAVTEKSTVMTTKRFVLPLAAAIFVAVIALTKCEGPEAKPGTQDSTNTHLNSPAPDNNSATNPSMADTAFQKDSSKLRKDSSR